MRVFVSAVTLLLLCLLMGCSQNAVITPPPAGAVADYQLGGGYAPAADVRVVTRDSTDKPARGIYSICYVNGFQSQPGSSWPADLLVSDSSGRALTDPGWPDEHIFDLSTPPRRARLVTLLRPTIVDCAKHGFDAVEFDNLDSYSRSHRAFTSADAVLFATSLVAIAHHNGLAAAQKNTVELSSVGSSVIGFDFAMTEECFQYRECAGYTRVYGSRVIDVEYTDSLKQPFSAVCASSRRPASVILRDRDLLPAGARGHVYRHC